MSHDCHADELALAERVSELERVLGELLKEAFVDDGRGHPAYKSHNSIPMGISPKRAAVIRRARKALADRTSEQRKTK